MSHLGSTRDLGGYSECACSWNCHLIQKLNSENWISLGSLQIKQMLKKRGEGEGTILKTARGHT